MKKTIGILLALVTLLAVGVIPVLAQGNQPPVTPQPFGNAWRGMGPHSMDAEGPLHESMLAAWAKILGIPSEDLDARLAAGETMYTIAADFGYEGQEFYSLMLQARAVALQEAVAAGVLPQEQADWMLSHVGRGGYWMGAGADAPQLQGGYGHGAMGRFFQGGARP
jgi:hypothetical protein